jgi:hypothetical protein
MRPIVRKRFSIQVEQSPNSGYEDTKITKQESEKISLLSK